MSKAQVKQQQNGQWAVRDSRTGRFMEIRGADSMKGSHFPLKKNVDLTKPIAAQALKGSKSAAKH